MNITRSVNKYSSNKLYNKTKLQYLKDDINYVKKEITDLNEEMDKVIDSILIIYKQKGHLDKSINLLNKKKEKIIENIKVINEQINNNEKEIDNDLYQISHNHNVSNSLDFNNLKGGKKRKTRKNNKKRIKE